MAYYTPAAREFLSEVAQAYQNSPGEVALAVGIIGTLLFGLSGYLVVQGRRSARRQQEWAEAEFRRTIEARDVPPSSVDALERMAQAWGKPQRKHRVVQEPATFDQAARQALRDGSVRPETVSALRVTLGIVHRNDRVPKSTTELAPDSPVHLRRRGREAVAGRIHGRHPDGFSVALGSAASSFPAGCTVDMLIKTPGGVFHVRTFSQGFEEGILHLRHREEIRHKQQRRHFRHSLRAQARIVVAGDGGRNEWVRLHDLGGGGASFTDPFTKEKEQGALAEGDALTVVLPGIGRNGGELSLPATVVRLSSTQAGERRCHVAFTNVPESDRDRIYQLLFSAERGNENRRRA